VRNRQKAKKLKRKNMQKWEYKTIRRRRSIRTFRGVLTGWDTDIEAMLPKLGEEGWELVAVSGRSSAFGMGYAGTTNDELWVFKRPKE
jgi:hypothetical protein